MADSILRLRVDSAEYNNKLKQATNGLTRYVDECRKVGGTLEVVEKETLDYVRALGQMDTTSRTATGKLAEMKKTFTELSVVYKNMTDQEKNSPFGKALATSLDQLKGRIGESKVQLDDINKSINGGGGLTGALDNMLGKVGLNVEGLMKFGGAAGAATTALKVAKDAFFASESSFDEWGRTVQSSQSLYQGFLSALNNSDISGFLSRMDDIVSAAREAYNAMDELGTFSAFQQRNVAKGRAGYAQALDEYRLNPTADNKQKLQQANQKVMNDLRESHDKTEAAYQAALRQIATERIKGKDMQDAFVKMFSEGNYGDLKAAKSGYKTGRGLNSGAQYYTGDRVYDGRVQDKTTGKWRDMSATEKQQFEFARALSQVNDSQIKEVQALGAQSIAITEQIYQQDRAYNRLAGNNAPLRGGGGHSVGGKGGGTNELFDPTSIAAQEKLVQELTKLWRTCGETVRDEYKARLDEAKAVLQEMQNPTKQLEMAEVSDLSGRNPKANFTHGAEFNPMERIGNIREMINNDLSDELERLKELLANAFDPESIKAYSEAIASVTEKMGELKGDKKQGTKADKGEQGKLLSEFNEKAEKFVGGLASISNGFKGLGVEFPKEVDSLINILSSVMQIIQGVQAVISIFQVGAITANTTALTVNTAALIGRSFFGFQNGGVVHAASGYAVPGNSFSGDNIPIMANAGEVVLTRAMAGNLASQLQGTGLGNMELVATVRAEQIDFVMNNRGRRTGRGEYVQSNKRR